MSSPRATPEEVLNGTPSATPGTTQENTPNRAPEDTPVATIESSPKATRGTTPIEISDDSSDAPSDCISAEDAPQDASKPGFVMSSPEVRGEEALSGIFSATSGASRENTQVGAEDTPVATVQSSSYVTRGYTPIEISDDSSIAPSRCSSAEDVSQDASKPGSVMASPEITGEEVLSDTLSVIFGASRENTPAASEEDMPVITVQSSSHVTRGNTPIEISDDSSNDSSGLSSPPPSSEEEEDASEDVSQEEASVNYASEDSSAKLSGSELSENEFSENELSENEPSENELSENEPSENELSENEPLENELSENEPSDNEMADNEQSVKECLDTYLEVNPNDTSQLNGIISSPGLPNDAPGDSPKEKREDTLEDDKEDVPENEPKDTSIIAMHDISYGEVKPKDKLQALMNEPLPKVEFNINSQRANISTWNLECDNPKKDPFYYVSIFTERSNMRNGEILMSQLPRQMLLGLLPELNRYVCPSTANIMLPGLEYMVDDDTLCKVIEAVLNRPSLNGEFRMYVREDPVDYIMVHVILTLLGMRSEAKTVQDRLWLLFSTVELTADHVAEIWEQVRPHLEAHRSAQPLLNLGIVPFAEFYVEVMAWHILNMRALGRLDAKIEDYVFHGCFTSQPLLRHIVQERQQRYGLNSGYIPSTSVIVKTNYFAGLSHSSDWKDVVRREEPRFLAREYLKNGMWNGDNPRQIMHNPSLEISQPTLAMPESVPEQKVQSEAKMELKPNLPDASSITVPPMEFSRKDAGLKDWNIGDKDNYKTTPVNAQQEMEKDDCVYISRAQYVAEIDTLLQSRRSPKILSDPLAPGYPPPIFPPSRSYSSSVAVTTGSNPPVLNLARPASTSITSGSFAPTSNISIPGTSSLFPPSARGGLASSRFADSSVSGAARSMAPRLSTSGTTGVGFGSLPTMLPNNPRFGTTPTSIAKTYVGFGFGTPPAIQQSNQAFSTATHPDRPFGTISPMAFVPAQGHTSSVANSAFGDSSLGVNTESNNMFAFQPTGSSSRVNGTNRANGSRKVAQPKSRLPTRR